MTAEIGLFLFILAVAMALFSFERIPADAVGLGVLLSLILTGLLPSDSAFAGFGSSTVMMILGLLILTAALVRTGVVDIVGRATLRYTGEGADRLLVVIMLASATMGAFMSNTASTAFFIPLVFGLAQRAQVSPSKLLMPLAFSSILSSSVTLVSTSTNIVVSGLMTQYQMPPMGMFELAPVGIPIAVVGLAYMFFIGRHFIPDRQTADGSTEGSKYPYLTEIMVLPESSLVGKTLAESALGEKLDLKVLQIIRGKNRYMAPQGETRLEENDVLLVEGWRDDILKASNISGLDIKANVKLSDPELQTEDARLVEAILLPRSPLIGRTLKGFRFRERYGLQVLAINRQGETIRRKISEVLLRMGDVLLVQGHRANIAALEAGNVFRILTAVEDRRPQARLAPLAVAIFLGSLVLATFDLVSLPVAVLLGALLAFLTRCITPEEAYRDVEWKAIILIGSMLALGAAMEETGAAEFFAAQIVNFVGAAQPVWLLTAFFALTVLLTQPMSNQAAAIVLVPVAIQTALRLDLNPRTFAMMIAVAASCSYLTPLEPSCLMVYGPGRYRFMDFLKVGSLLTVLIYLIAIFLVPLIWPIK
jgi:di/tricarboxylate transporter